MPRPRAPVMLDGMALPSLEAPAPVRATGQTSSRPEGRSGAERSRTLPARTQGGEPAPSPLGQYLDLLV